MEDARYNISTEDQSDDEELLRRRDSMSEEDLSDDELDKSDSLIIKK